MIDVAVRSPGAAVVAHFVVAFTNICSIGGSQGLAIVGLKKRVKGLTQHICYHDDSANHQSSGDQPLERGRLPRFDRKLQNVNGRLPVPSIGLI